MTIVGYRRSCGLSGDASPTRRRPDGSACRDRAALSARAGRRGGGRPGLRRRLRDAAAEGEDAHLAPLPGRARRPRHLLRPEVRANLEMRDVLEAIITHPAGVDPATLDEITRYTKLFWINTGPYNNLTARKFVLRMHAGRLRGRGACGRAGRRDVSAQGRRNARSAARAARADLLRSRRRSDRHDQDAAGGQGHPRRPAPTTCTSA